MFRVYLELSRETSTLELYTDEMQWSYEGPRAIIAALCPIIAAIVCFSLLRAKSRNEAEDITMFSSTQLENILTVARLIILEVCIKHQRKVFK